MAMRNPIYLDVDLLENAADYYDVGISVDTQIVETGETATEFNGGLKAHIVNVGGGHTEKGQVQSTYAIRARPVRVMNDVIDQAKADGDIKPSENTDESYYKDDLVEIHGILTQAPASAIGAMFGKLIPVFMGQQKQSGELSEEEAAMYSAFLGNAMNDAAENLVYSLQSDEFDFDVVVEVDPAMFFKNRTVNDFRGNLTVFGQVSVIAEEGQEIPMDRYLLPGMSPEIRGMMGTHMDQGIESMFDSLSPQIQAAGIDSVKKLIGPAMIIRPIAIY